MLLEFLLAFSLLSSSNSIPLSDFFPFGSTANDSIIPFYNTSIGPLRLPHVFPYFDNNYKELWITRNGVFCSFRAPDYFPPHSWFSSNESIIVAGFWHERIWNIYNDTGNGNQVHYQIYHSNKTLSNLTQTVFNKITDYVSKFFPQQRVFKPEMVITGTWYNIRIDTHDNKTLRNTFQIVLCTDEDRSFIFFLYHELQWAIPNNYSYDYSQAGFYYGNGNISEMFPYSGTEDIVKLANESNVKIPGLFAFRVDANLSSAGGCDENTGAVSFRPRTSSQFGSTAISIYGPCFTNITKIKCQFGSSPQTTVDGIIIDDFRAVCLTPFESRSRLISVNISTDGGTKYKSAGHLSMIPLKYGSDEVIIETEDNDTLIHSGQYIKLRWKFTEITRKTFPNNATIDIELWKVSLNVQSALNIDSTPIVLMQNMSMSDSTRVQLPVSINNVPTCFIRVVVRFNAQTYAGLNTGLLIVRIPPSLAQARCRNWASQQSEPSMWNSFGLLTCPMTRWQAKAAGRCCYVPDRNCYSENSHSTNCWLHQARPGRNESSAVECYMSITSNIHGAEAECCYDDNGIIITRGTGAGTDNRYGQTTSPILHLFDDTLPYLQCCMMNASFEDCDTYMHYRPPRRGTNTMGENGRMWGDPHFGTLDGASYTFNGHGEYVYLAITNDSLLSPVFNTSSQSHIFISQIRTVPIASEKATVTKAFAARSYGINDTSISITISHRENIVIYRENERLEFEDNIDSFFYSDLTIRRLDGDSTIKSRFRISWTIGVTIEIDVIEITSPSKQLVLNIAASVAGVFHGKTYGLLGSYDGNASNDLRNKNGTIIPINASPEQIHYGFGVTWAIDPSSSLFTYESNQTNTFYKEMNDQYRPSFDDPLTINNATYRNSCKIDEISLPSTWSLAQKTCYYDLSTTKDENFAKASLNAGNGTVLDQENHRNPPSFNESLPLQLNPMPGHEITLNLLATSEYAAHVIELRVLKQPENSTFDGKTGEFKWRAIRGEHYLSIEAHDKNFSRTAKHEISFKVKANEESVTTSSSIHPATTTARPATTTARPATTTARPSGSNNLVQEVMIIISMFGLLGLLA